MFLGCDALIHLYARENYKMTLEHSDDKVSIKNYFEEYLCYDDIYKKFYFDEEPNIYFELIDNSIFCYQGLYLSFFEGNLILSETITRLEIVSDFPLSSSLFLKNDYIRETLLTNEHSFHKKSTKEEAFFVNFFLENGMSHLIPNYYYVNYNHLLIEKFSYDLSQIKIKDNTIIFRNKKFNYGFDIKSYIKNELIKILNGFIDKNIFDCDFYSKNFVISLSEFPIIKRIDLELCVLCKSKEECIQMYRDNYDVDYTEFIVSEIL